MSIANVNLSADMSFILKNILNVKSAMRFDAKLLVNKVDFIQRFIKTKCHQTTNSLKLINTIVEYD